MISSNTRVGIIDYGMGNLYSLERALLRLKVEPARLADPARARDFTHLILPGVGSAGPAMARLDAAGWPDALAQWTLDEKPLLGICLGFQLLFDFSEENGGVEGLGLLPGSVARFADGVKIPHMGWNEVRPQPGARLFAGIGPADFYFVHGYFASDVLEQDAAAACDYGGEFTCAVEAPGQNLYGVQFHPEKSAAAGARLLNNYLVS